MLRTNSTRLYDRLTARQYPERKLQENLDSEIMQVLLEEARQSYDEEIIVELESNESVDIEKNVDRISIWINQWKREHADNSAS